MRFENKTVFITGASRGIGKAIGLRLAKEGANIIIAAKSTVENPKLGGTIFSAAQEMEEAGGKALAVQCDIRFEEQIQYAVDKAVATFGGIDILINNASAISLAKTELTTTKQFDLINAINVRGTFFVSKACIPHLKKSGNAHILTLSPPVNLLPIWFEAHLAYTMSKYNMSMIAIGLATELKQYKIASNTLWPKTIIATAAIKNFPGGDQLMNMSRIPGIIADAAWHILHKPSEECTGNHFIDEEVLALAGVTDFSEYSVIPNGKLYPDLFL